MQEWIIAMLVISVMLILRDMAKTFLKGKKPNEEIAAALCADHPRREKIERYAQAFRKLADTFYGMPYRKEYLSSGQIEEILRQCNEQVCSKCYQRDVCWGEHAKALYQGSEGIIRAFEEGDEETIRQLRKDAPWCRVIVGGAVLNPEYAAAIGADFYAKDAMETVRYAEEIHRNLS